ncbi:MAG: hypothetical protein U9R32_04630 [Bacteroidota bacterium]|nr:hypothetical protein [Bacteroidota bacterium]
MDKKEKIIIAINSLSYFIIAYIVVFLTANLSQAVMASFHGISTSIADTRLLFFASGNDWTFGSVKGIFITKPLALLLLMALSLLIYTKSIVYKGYLKLLFIWIFFHSALCFSSDIIWGGLMRQGIGHVLSWFYINDTGKLFFCLFGMSILAISTKLFTRFFVLSGNIYFEKFNKKTKKTLLLYSFLFPLIGGEVMIFALGYPSIGIMEILTLMVIIPMAYMVIINFGRKKERFIAFETPNKIKIANVTFVIMVITFVAAKIIFSNKLINIS